MHRGFRGIELGATRSKTVQQALSIDWNFPVYTPEKDRSKGTKSPELRRALDPEQAFRVIAGDNKRPLLVLREFSSFDDSGNEKLSRKLYTERTVLLSHWFRCVRLPHHVVEEDHPFHNLYAGKKPPQLFLASANGAELEPFDYTSTRADLEKLMNRFLAEYYVKKPGKVIEELIKLMKRLDKLDVEIQNLKEEMDKAVEESSPRSGKARKLKGELVRAEEEWSSLKAKRDEIRSIPLKERD
ncbi:MAG: hypothetical protein ACYTG7_11825 [Planctomycetota bacterium]|jgi:hypothetical protein